jgi:hypothetical protein
LHPERTEGIMGLLKEAKEAAYDATSRARRGGIGRMQEMLDTPWQLIVLRFIPMIP